MAVTPEQLEQIIKEVKQAQAYQAGAWHRVQETARQWAQMKMYGSYVQPNGSVCTVAHSDQLDQQTYYHRRLLEEIERAFLEDALTGQAIQRAIG